MRRTIVIILPVLLIGVLTYSIYKANWQNPFSDSFSGDLDDSEIHIRSFEDARALRQQALEFIWPGEKRLPTQLPDQVLKDTPSPFRFPGPLAWRKPPSRAPIPLWESAGRARHPGPSPETWPERSTKGP